MKSPFFRLTSRCDSKRCKVDTFVTERKRITYESTAGTTQTRTRQVCPECKAWGTIINIEEVKP